MIKTSGWFEQMNIVIHDGPGNFIMTWVNVYIFKMVLLCGGGVPGWAAPLSAWSAPMLSLSVRLQQKEFAGEYVL